MVHHLAPWRTSKTSVAVLELAMAPDTDAERERALGKSFTLALQQAVSSLSSLQLGLHQTQRLPGRKDSFTILANRQSCRRG